MTKLRFIPAEGGKRQGMRQNESTWKAIDHLAAIQGLTWAEWTRRAIDAAAGTDASENVTEAVRAAAMRGVLDLLTSGERAEQLQAMDAHPLMRNSGVLDDDQFSRAMRGAALFGQSDFGGFTVFFGHDEAGQDVVWVRNGMRDGLHFAFVVPSPP